MYLILDMSTWCLQPIQHTETGGTSDPNDAKRGSTEQWTPPHLRSGLYHLGSHSVRESSHRHPGWLSYIGGYTVLATHLYKDHKKPLFDYSY